MGEDRDMDAGTEEIKDRCISSLKHKSNTNKTFVS